jgi:hypothetical protein
MESAGRGAQTVWNTVGMVKHRVSTTPLSATIDKYMNNKELKWFKRPILHTYSVLDFARTLLTIIFISILISSLTIFIHEEIQRGADKNKVVEYVNMQNHDIVFDNGIEYMPDLIIKRVLKFPLAYNENNTTGYILQDKKTGVKYIYIHTGGPGGGPALTRYWEKKDVGKVVDKGAENTK